MRRRGFLGVAAALPIALGTSGCAFLSALPEIMAGVNDAGLILDQIERWVGAFVAKSPNADLKKKVDEAMAICRSTLDAAERTLATIKDVSQKQYDAAIADFEAAFNALMEIVKEAGVKLGDASLKTFKVSRDELVVPQPLLLTYKVRR